MGCCGKKRAQWAAERSRPAEAADRQGAAVAAIDASDPARPDGPTWFEYVGRSRLSAAGAVSRRIYHFAGPGARVAVEAEDAAAFRGEPELRVVRAEG